MKRISNILAMLAISTFSVAILAAPSANAFDIFEGSCGGAVDNSVCDAREDDLATLLANVIDTLLVLIGIVAVIMLIIGGFKYVTSNGDSSAMQSAKNTILYAIVGIVVAVAAFAIVSFVLGRIGI